MHVLCVEVALKTYDVLHDLNHGHAHARHLQQRCGLHTGTVVGGVLGSTTLAFDLWGVDVNYGSCMESLGVPGKVQISSATYERVRDWYACTARKVEVPGQGEVTAYLVDGLASDHQAKLDTSTIRGRANMHRLSHDGDGHHVPSGASPVHRLSEDKGKQRVPLDA